MTIMYAEQPLHLVADDYDDNHTDTQPKYGRVAGEGRRSIAPAWNWSSHLFRGQADGYRSSEFQELVKSRFFAVFAQHE